jgi:ATP-dependent RNA helicase SUPV3L1/SUV3
LAEIFSQLTGPRGVLDPDWMAAKVARGERSEGDLDTLLTRIAFDPDVDVHLASAGHWVVGSGGVAGAMTRAIEDRLSDALHERLTQRFVDPRARSFSGTNAAIERPRGGGGGGVKRTVVVPEVDSPFRQLAALRFAVNPADVIEQGPLADEAARIVEAPYEAFTVDARGQIKLGELAVATMSRGADLLRPEVQLTLADGFGAGAQAQVRRRMLAWTRDLVAELLAPLRAEAAGRLKAAGKGLVYQLEQGLGSVLRARCEAQVQGLDADDRKLCAQLKITVGGAGGVRAGAARAGGAGEARGAVVGGERATARAAEPGAGVGGGRGRCAGVVVSRDRVPALRTAGGAGRSGGAVVQPAAAGDQRGAGGAAERAGVVARVLAGGGGRGGGGDGADARR